MVAFLEKLNEFEERESVSGDFFEESLDFRPGGVNGESLEAWGLVGW